MAAKIKVIIQSQPVSLLDRRGRRIQKPRWGKVETWAGSENQFKNFARAVTEANKRLMESRVGSVVFARAVVNGRLSRTITKLYQTKWGTDGKPFARYEGPVGEWWRRRSGLRSV